MKLSAKEAGIQLYKKKNVKLDYSSDIMTYFSVKKTYSVIFNKYTWNFNCSCQHGSLWGVNKPEEFCKHVWAVKEHLKSMEMSRNNTS